MLGARCKIQNGYYNIHDASQGSSCKLHHNILHFLQCYFYILHFKAPLKHILQKMNLNRWKISPHKLFSKQIVNRALRSTLNASLLDEKKSHFPKAVFETISHFFSGTFSWIYVQFIYHCNLKNTDSRSRNVDHTIIPASYFFN